VEVGEDIAIELAQASEPMAETEEAAAIGVTPDPNRGYGGRAATGRIVREPEKERLKALRAKPKTRDPVQDWLEGPEHVLRENG
jgi:hypothetical protein